MRTHTSGLSNLFVCLSDHLHIYSVNTHICKDTVLFLTFDSSKNYENNVEMVSVLKISVLECFLKGHVIRKTGVMTAHRSQEEIPF